MTNTPMTSREAFEQWHKSQYQGYNSYSYKHDTTAYIDDYVEIAFTAWQAGQAQQQAVIAELVEALEEIKVKTDDIYIRHVAKDAIAKVKGK